VTCLFCDVVFTINVKIMKLNFTLTLFLLLVVFPATSQVKLGSFTDQYYDLLALEGKVERPWLSYRTLSDSEWSLSDTTNHVWSQQQKLFRRNQKFSLYGPETYVSYNSQVPYGQNDGLLWQGRGVNTYLSMGVRYVHRGLAITLKPEVAFSGNQAFEFVTPASAFNADKYQDKARVYGYFGTGLMDAPQRFGNKPIWAAGWGDSEIRYTSKTFTVGFGTQYTWLGPARLNPILHSINAPSYPKFDIGIRPTRIRFGKWDAGLIEARLFLGQLRESAWYDNDPENDYRLFSGLNLAYAPSFLPGLTLSANRHFLCKWELSSLMSIADLMYIPWNMHGGRDNFDQRASVGMSYLHPASGFEVYTEIGFNDFSPGIDGYVRYPFHSMVHTTGMRKVVPLYLFNQPMKGELLLEVSGLEMSQDFQFQSPSTFYNHGQVHHGYTHLGQWLGATNIAGGNSQYLGFTTYHRKGSLKVYVHRTNPDNDYIYQYSVGTVNSEEVRVRIRDFKAVLSSGVQAIHFINQNLQLSGGISFITEHNPLYNAIRWEETSKRHSLQLRVGAVWNW
jgi:hypothetical protein